MTVYYSDDLVTLHHGDCLEVLASLPDCSVDSVVTDPPYELTAGKKGGTGAASVNLNSPYGRARIGTGNGSGGFMGKAWDATGVAHDPAWWAQCLRVLKPGGHLLAFGGTRTWHRLACAVEDAGFEIRDSIAWLYGSGFPKSLDVSKAIDKAAGAERLVIGINPRAAQQTAKLDATSLGRFAGTSADLTAPASEPARQWQGWGTALKPAFEPVVVARKPLVGTVAQNVTEHGTGALNIDATRIGRVEGDRTEYGRDRHLPHANASASIGNFAEVTPYTPSPSGRWPANVALDEGQAAVLDEQSGITRDGVAVNRNRGEVKPQDVAGAPVRVLHEDQGYGGSGGASRFMYVAKAPKSERPTVDSTSHPTVKPLTLMRWLVRLVTPPGGVVLEPFAGSGTTIEAAVLEGFRVIGIEREADYLPLIEQRIRRRPQSVESEWTLFDDGAAS